MNQPKVYSGWFGHIFTVRSGLFDCQFSTKQTDDTLPGNAYYRSFAEVEQGEKTKNVIPAFAQ